MSRNEETASDEAQDAPATDSVYDFLYHDARRIGSFLSQFDPSGHLTGIKQTEGVDGSASTRVTGNASAGVPGIAKGGAAAEGLTSKTEREALERTYDPLWTNALALLDFLDERNLILRDLTQARIGQFVLASGSLMVLDLAMLKSAWEIPAIKKLVSDGAKAGLAPQSRQERRTKQQDALQQTDILFALLKILPHSLQARLIGSNTNVWCSLDEASVIGRASDLMLKHGSLIGGEWNMLGVMDAYPYDPDHVTDDGEPFGHVLAGLAATPVGQLAVGLAPVSQALLGRPPAAHGMTPLMIFREVSA